MAHGAPKTLGAGRRRVRLLGGEHECMMIASSCGGKVGNPWKSGSSSKSSTKGAGCCSPPSAPPSAPALLAWSKGASKPGGAGSEAAASSAARSSSVAARAAASRKMGASCVALTIAQTMLASSRAEKLSIVFVACHARSSRMRVASRLPSPGSMSTTHVPCATLASSRGPHTRLPAGSRGRSGTASRDAAGVPPPMPPSTTFSASRSRHTVVAVSSSCTRWSRRPPCLARKSPCEWKWCSRFQMTA